MFLPRVDHDVRDDASTGKTELQRRQRRHCVMQAEGKLHVFHGQRTRCLEAGGGVVDFRVNRLQSPALEFSARQDALALGRRRAGRQDLVAAGLSFPGLRLRARVGLGLRRFCRRARACRRARGVFGFQADDGTQVGDVEQFAAQPGGEQRARLLPDIGGAASDVGRANLSAQVIHAVALALLHQTATKFIGRRSRQRQQQKGIQACQRLAGNLQARVDGADVDDVGYRAFNLHLGRAGIEPALDGKGSVRFLKAQHIAGKRLAAKARLVVLALEGIARGVAGVVGPGHGVRDLGGGGRHEGAGLDVNTQGLAVIDVTQLALADREAADAKTAGLGGVRGCLQDPVLALVGRFLENDIRLRQGGARHKNLAVPEVTQRDGKFERADLRHGLAGLGPIGVGKVQVPQLDGGRQAQIDIEVGNAELALGFVRDVTLERLAKPVPVEHQPQDQHDGGAAQQDPLPAFEPQSLFQLRCCWLRHRFRNTTLAVALLTSLIRFVPVFLAI